jgi:glucose-1-phosphate thymidylyltransferase
VKALVLSGGAATRLRPLSYRIPKQLIPIANKPVLEYVLESIAAIEVDDVAIVVGDWGAQIADTIGDGSRFGLRVSYLRQRQPLGLAHGVRLARRFLDDDDFVMYLGDNVLPDGIGELAAAFDAARPTAQVTVHEVPNPREFGVAELDPRGNLLRLVEKPQQPRSNLALVGVYFFTSAIHQAIAAIRPSDRGELEITDAVQWLLTHRASVTAVEHSGYWQDAGNAEDILTCNRHLLARLRPDIAGEVDPHSEVDGQVVIEAGARIVRSRIAGPSIIGANTLVENSRIGPNTAVGSDCVLRGAQLADSIVLSGTPAPGGMRVAGSLVAAGQVLPAAGRP